MNQQLLASIYDSCQPLHKGGQTASYIPQLATVDPALLGICVASPGGELWQAGDAQHRFTIQSISKVFVFTCALLDNGVDRILQKVSLEPTADSFNSITALETKNFNKPLNPFINAGAIACLTQVAGDSAAERVRRVLAFCREVSGNPALEIDQAVYQSEKATGARNRALAYFMKSTGVLECDVEELLDTYFQICAIQMDCADLARTALVYAGDGAGHFSKKVARTVLATMTMCGMYDESGTTAVTVGLPCKSGVGGGIMAAKPGDVGIAVFGPALGEKGSSVAGLAALQQLSERMDLSIF